MLHRGVRAMAFWQDESGATALEYGIIASAVALMLVPALTDTQGSVLSLYKTVVSLFAKAGTP